jgi:hypothetical protein
MAWRNDRPCCVMTWSTLLLLGQLTQTFDKSGTILMRRLSFWAGSQQARTARARALAIQIDGTYRDMFGSKYESGVTRQIAVPRILGVLLTAGASVEQLADANDLSYLFLGESAS